VGFRRAPLFARQPAYKPGSGRHANTRMRDGHSSGTPVTRRLKQPTRTAGSGHHPEAVLAHGFAPSLFGLAPGGVCHAAAVTVDAVRSYRTFSPLPRLKKHRGGMFSVALSLDSHPPDVIRHHFVRGARTFLSGTLSALPERPSDRLTSSGMVISKRSVKACLRIITAQA
jgi:hypothetical protein